MYKSPMIEQSFLRYTSTIFFSCLECSQHSLCENSTVRTGIYVHKCICISFIYYFMQSQAVEKEKLSCKYLLVFSENCLHTCNTFVVSHHYTNI